MKTMVFYFLLAFLALLLFYLLYQPKFNDADVSNVLVKNIKINGTEFALEVANTPAFRQKGLMDRKQMALDKGMLFVFDTEGIYPFWMKNTYIPLDIVWIDTNWTVVYIAENVQPCGSVVEALCKSVIPTKKAKYVIELNAGTVQEIGLKVGEHIGSTP